jgi:TonB family protein
VLIAMAGAAIGYFLVLKKAPAGEGRTEARPAAVEKTAAQLPAVQRTPVVDLQAQAAENQKREEELQKQIKAAADAADAAALKQKLQDEKRAKQAENERLKKEADDRLKQEELDRLQKDEARKKQEELDRLAQEALDLKKAEELKELERKRVKEGDVIPLGEADKEPLAVSKPEPTIPSNMRASMTSSQTVLFNILVNQNGDVEVARLMQKTNNSQLNAILVSTIKSWKFSPAVKDGVRVKVWKTIPLIIKK